MKIGEVVDGLKNQKCFTRPSMNGFITKQNDSQVNEQIIPHMSSLNQTTKDILMRTTKSIKYINQVIIINDGNATSYNLTTEDLFAEDWEVVV